MVCGGYVCARNMLCALNVLYMLVSVVLIAVAVYGKWFGLISSFQVIGAVIGVGVFVFFLGTLGLCGVLNHHQVLLFFYMFILLIVFIVQFAISCACLAITKQQQNLLLEVTWNNSVNMQKDLEKTLNCCDFSHINYNRTRTCGADCVKNSSCNSCSTEIQTYADEALRFVGVTSLFFSFTEILGVWLTYKFRNIKDPRLNPRAFI